MPNLAITLPSHTPRNSDSQGHVSCLLPFQQGTVTVMYHAFCPPSATQQTTLSKGASLVSDLSVFLQGSSNPPEM